MKMSLKIAIAASVLWIFVLLMMRIARAIDFEVFVGGYFWDTYYLDPVFPVPEKHRQEI